MPVLSWIVLTADELAAARAMDDEAAAIGGREIDGADAGDLRGRFAVNARVLHDPAYQRWHDILAPFPVQALDTDVIFAPPADEA